MADDGREPNIPQLRSEARRLARSGEMKYRVALDHLAKGLGYAHWNALLERSTK